MVQKKHLKKSITSIINLSNKFAFFECQDNNIAEDLSQETFIKLWNNKEKIDPKKY